MQVDQWLNFIHKRFTPVSDASLTELNAWLATRTFLCGHIMTLADLCMYAALSLEMVRPPDSVFVVLKLLIAVVRNSLFA